MFTRVHPRLNPLPRAVHRCVLLVLCAIALPACGINKSRLATEQLVISEAVDKAVATIDFSALSGHKVYFDTQYLDGLNMGPNGNVKYVISSLRQQMMAYDLRLQEKADTADYVVEGRLGVLANDGYEVTYGIPGNAAAASATAFLAAPVPVSPQVPELSVGRRNHQAGSAKVGLFAYDRVTREPVWQAGVKRGASDVRDTWFMGLGPYQTRSKTARRFWQSKQNRNETASEPLSAYNSSLVFEAPLARLPPSSKNLPNHPVSPAAMLPLSAPVCYQLLVNKISPRFIMDDSPQIMQKTPQTSGNPRVLIVRLSAIGDCLQTMPLACAIREHWSTAHITWVAEKVAAPLVAACDAVDRVIVVPKGFSKSWKLLRRLRNTLTATPFDFAFDPQGLTKSGLVAWLSGAKRRLGFARPASRELNPFLQSELITSAATPRVERYLELLRPFGLQQPRVRFGLTLPAASRAACQEVIAQNHLSNGFAILNPGAGWDSKRWPTDRYAAVANHLFSRGIASLVVWAGQQEHTWAQEIVSRSGASATLAPSTSLLELAALLERATLFVGSDTGPLHLAAAMNTPCVALFGASSGQACGPYGYNHRIVQIALDESPRRKQPGAENWAMRAIGANSVCTACDAVLAVLAAQSGLKIVPVAA